MRACIRWSLGSLAIGLSFAFLLFPKTFSYRPAYTQFETDRTPLSPKLSAPVYGMGNDRPGFHPDMPLDDRGR